MRDKMKFDYYYGIEAEQFSCDRQSIRLHKRGGRLCHGRIQKAWI